MDSWPLNAKVLGQIITSGESDLVEHKGDWPDLGSQRGKAEFVRDVLSLANTTRPGHGAYLIYGVRDLRQGGEITGVQEAPQPEQVAQILSSYTSPVPDLRCQHLEHCGCRLSVAGIFWNNNHPYFATRDHPPVLSETVAYIRRGPTNGIMKMSELEQAIRMKDSRVGPPTPGDPLRVGFVEAGSLSGPRGSVARIVNISGEPVNSITAVMDVVIVAEPRARCREKLLIDATLQPAESHELELNLAGLSFYVDSELFQWKQHAAYRAVNVELHVRYRARDGFFRFLVSRLALCD